MEISKCSKIVGFPKIFIKMKNWKTFYEAQTASHLKEIIQPPPNPPTPGKSYYFSGTKYCYIQRYTEIYRHLLSKCFKNEVPGRQEMVQYSVFSDNEQKHVFWKNFKARKAFGFLREHIIFNVKWVKFRKMSEVIWAKLYCKMSDLFG